MKKTWSDRREWEGFSPTGYRLNFDVVWNLPLRRFTKEQDVHRDEPTTLGQAYIELRDKPEVSLEGWGTLKVKTVSGEYGYIGPSFNEQLLTVALRLNRDGYDAFEALWFWYDEDTVTDDPHDSYEFFVVHGDKLVVERVSLSDHSGSGFDPAAFKPPDHSNNTWRSERRWYEARVQYWYRKFYQETDTGRLMVLRPDEPPLFYFGEGRWHVSVGFQAVLVLLSRIKMLLVVLIGIGCLIALLLWK